MAFAWIFLNEDFTWDKYNLNLKFFNFFVLKKLQILRKPSILNCSLASADKDISV